MRFHLFFFLFITSPEILHLDKELIYCARSISVSDKLSFLLEEYISVVQARVLAYKPRVNYRVGIAPSPSTDLRCAITLELSYISPQVSEP